MNMLQLKCFRFYKKKKKKKKKKKSKVKLLYVKLLSGKSQRVTFFKQSFFAKVIECAINEAALQVTIGNRDFSDIISLVSQRNICCEASLELSLRDCFNDASRDGANDD